ncbi:hypothetical protein HPB49_009723 [Dermacentor silvarum]|uniref:Uncharacterized protein n=1 Tax=Dermacentor silvarum TaxID=543639 RepID=A0ACB8CEE4_DERSI|nr:hypothetical protein HPB49_009723 [Dermacentor silvarum]
MGRGAFIESMMQLAYPRRPPGTAALELSLDAAIGVNQSIRSTSRPLKNTSKKLSKRDTVHSLRRGSRSCAPRFNVTTSVMAGIRHTHLLLGLCALAALGGLLVTRLGYINVDVNFSRFRDIVQDRDQDSDAFSDVVLVKPTPRPYAQPGTRLKPRLPPLPPSDYKIAFPPRDGLDFSKWQSHHVARAVSQASHITATESDALTLRIRNEQNLAVASTPKEERAERIRRITALQLGGKEYQVCAYVAGPDISSKGVATGIDSETHPDELMDNLRSPQAPILFARMLGKSTAAPITFDGLEVPRRIFYYVCSICLKTGHRADICPTPESPRCKNCGHENPPEDHQCQPNCVLSGGDHSVTDPSCLARQRKRFNKSHFLRNAGYTSDANNIHTSNNPGRGTNQPQTPR